MALTPERRFRILTNTLAQVVGRNAIALLRLVLAGLIIRGAGAATFAEYSILFGLLTLVEWIVDFGTTEIFVRDVARSPAQQVERLRLLLAAKAYQTPLAFAVLAAALLVLDYSAEVVRAGLLGGVSLIFFAVILVYRVLFRATLKMEREALAELVSVAAMIPMVFAVTRCGGGLMALMASHVVSRAVYLAVAWRLGRDGFRLSIAAVPPRAATAMLRSASTIGAIGLLAGAYELTDLLLLSKLSSLPEVAHYSAAQRLCWPLLMALASIAATLYPVASAYWPEDRETFRAVTQRGVDAVVVLGGLVFSAFLAGPEFFLGLLDPAMVVAVPVLRVMAVLCLVKSVSSTIGPLLYIVHAQGYALRFVVVALMLKTTVLLLLAPRYGALGVAIGALAIECAYSVTATVFLFQRFSGCTLEWVTAAKTAITVGAVVLIAHLLLPAGGLGGAVLAPLLYVPLVLLSGAARISDLELLLRRKTA